MSEVEQTAVCFGKRSVTPSRRSASAEATRHADGEKEIGRLGEALRIVAGEEERIVVAGEAAHIVAAVAVEGEAGMKGLTALVAE
jgi:hypothetical protein